MLKNAFLKTPLQNRTNVQIKGGGGVKGLLNNVQKNCTFLGGWLPLERRGGRDTMRDEVLGVARCVFKTQKQGTNY